MDDTPAAAQTTIMSAPARGAQPRHVRDAIVECIRLGEMVPGEILSIAMLASRYRVSATPVREALNQLLGAGVVVEDARGGFSVRRLDAGEYATLLDISCQLLLSAVRALPDLRCLKAPDVSDLPLDTAMAQAGSPAQRDYWVHLRLMMVSLQRLERDPDLPSTPSGPLREKEFRNWIKAYHRHYMIKIRRRLTAKDISNI